MSHELARAIGFPTAIAWSQGGLSADGAKLNLKRPSIVVPPLAEQERIVAKVNKFIGACERLEPQVEGCRDVQKAWLESPSHGALSDEETEQIATTALGWGHTDR